MQFSIATILTTAIAASTTVLAAPAPQGGAQSVSISFDTIYTPDRSLSTVSCSDGANGLMNRFPTLGSISIGNTKFPYVGGVPGIQWNSPLCGKCFSLTYNGKTIKIVGVDAGPGGYNLNKDAMNALTGGLADQLGRVTGTAVQVAC